MERVQMRFEIGATRALYGYRDRTFAASPMIILMKGERRSWKKSIRVLSLRTSWNLAF